MKFLRYFALLALLVAPLAVKKADAQVSVGIGVGGPAYYGPPSCQWGYYNYAPYACAPYGYYGSEWFSGGVFIGAGPWYRGGWGHYGYGYGRGYYGGYGHAGYYGRGGYYGGGYRGGYGGGYRGGYGGGGGYHGSAAGGGFHGGGGGGFHGGGGGGSHGGGHR